MLTKTAPFTMAGDPAELTPTTGLLHSGAHVFVRPEPEPAADAEAEAAAEAAHCREPAASYPYVPPLPEET
jgi:hypothetical protein